jgi:hypothetical protein
MISRFTYSDWQPSSFVLTMEMGPNANALQKAMTFTYSKGPAQTSSVKSGSKTAQ